MRRHRRDSRASHDRWLVSYADLVTLLFAFFTTLYAASTVDAKKLTPIASSVRNAFDASGNGVTGHSAGESIIAPVEIVARERALDVLRTRLTHDLADALQTKRLEMVRDARGVVLSLPEQATFPVGTADPTDEARELIQRLATTLATLPNPVRVEGHTDDVPIRTARFTSNWELSTARASAVVAYLVQSGGIDPQRLSAAGYGEFHPRAPNDSPENRARNRRIDLVVQPTEVDARR
jgi:chemotaxis protein MotB